jgi:hypothetical protein
MDDHEVLSASPEYDEDASTGAFEQLVIEEEASAVRAARMDAFLDRVEAAPPGSCPCCGRPF